MVNILVYTLQINNMNFRYWYAGEHITLLLFSFIFVSYLLSQRYSSRVIESYWDPFCWHEGDKERDVLHRISHDENNHHFENVNRGMR